MEPISKAVPKKRSESDSNNLAQESSIKKFRNYEVILQTGQKNGMNSHEFKKFLFADASKADLSNRQLAIILSKVSKSIFANICLRYYHSVHCKNLNSLLPPNPSYILDIEIDALLSACQIIMNHEKLYIWKKIKNLDSFKAQDYVVHHEERLNNLFEEAAEKLKKSPNAPTFSFRKCLYEIVELLEQYSRIEEKFPEILKQENNLTDAIDTPRNNPNEAKYQELSSSNSSTETTFDKSSPLPSKTMDAESGGL